MFCYERTKFNAMLLQTVLTVDHITLSVMKMHLLRSLILTYISTILVPMTKKNPNMVLTSKGNGGGGGGDD